jgi:hypothetical protein
MNYTWKITNIKRKDTQDLSNIIVQTYWKKIGTDDDGNIGEFDGATPFDLSTVDPNNFVAYDDLTEEIVLSWIQSVVVDEYERHVNEQIAKQIDAIVNPVTEETQNFPWSTQ